MFSNIIKIKRGVYFIWELNFVLKSMLRKGRLVDTAILFYTVIYF